MNQSTIKKYKTVIDEWFVNGFNGAAAYGKIYPNSSTKQGARAVNFSKIQNNPIIAEYIKEKHKNSAKKINTSHEAILKELQNWAEADITETIGLTSEQIKQLPVEFRRLITKYKTRLKHHYDRDGNLLHTEENIELHFVSKEKAIDMINKHVGFYEIDNRQKSSEINIHTTNEKHLAIVEKIINNG